MQLRPYQLDLFEQVVDSKDNMLLQLDTGAGKTPIIAKLAEHYEHVAVVCHRNILIKQASEKLAMCGVEHAILAARDTKKICANNNIAETGRHWLNPRSTVVLVSVDTFNSQLKSGRSTLDRNYDWILLIDEAHHFAEDNKWQVMQQHLNCRTIGFTATPLRSDGQPMIVEYGGFFDRIVQASGYEHNATERLISEGYLADYVAYYCEPIEVADWETGELIEAEDLSTDAGKDTLRMGKKAVEIIRKECEGKQTLVIFPRIANAERFCEDLAEKEIKAVAIHSVLPQYEIERVLSAFKAGHIKVLVSVDMINEGFDLPAVQNLVLCRNVGSFGFYRQMCGRVLRPSGTKAEIYDLTGENIPRHGLPSDPIDWTAAQEGQNRRDLTICTGCNAFVKRNISFCDHCGAEINARKKTEGVGQEVSIARYISKLKKQYRQQIQHEEREKIKADKQEKERRAKTETYINHSVKFGSSLVAKRCKYIFDTLKQELKSLTCSDYNAFFEKNISRFNDISFYFDFIDSDFYSKKREQCLKLYEAKK
mgnify:FL=1